MGSSGRGTLYDGKTARPQPVVVSADDDGLLIITADGQQHLPYAQVRRDRGGAVTRIRDAERPDWAVMLDVALPPEIAARLPHDAPLDRRSARVIGGALAVAVVAGVGLWLGGNSLLERLAPLLPYRVMEPIGRDVVTSIGRACTAKPGLAAAAKLQARLTPARGLADPITLTIVDLPFVNAIALPGGHVVIFRDLITKAASADEVAGVLAHEFVHIDRRHPAKALIRQVGISALLSSIGGSTAGYADLALVLGSTRKAEAEADAGAIALLRGANISPAALAGFFDRMRAADKPKAKSKDAAQDLLARLGAYARTHPADADRAARFRAAAIPGATPALSPAEWQALQTMCGPTPRTVAKTA